MKKTIRSFFTAALSLATLLITGSAWADTIKTQVYEGTKLSSATRLFPNLTLADLKRCTFEGRFGTASMGGTPKAAAALVVDSATDDTKLMIQFQVDAYNHGSDRHLKFVNMEFTEANGGISARQVSAGYVNNGGPDHIGEVRTETNGGYEIVEFAIGTPDVPMPYCFHLDHDLYNSGSGSIKYATKQGGGTAAWNADNTKGKFGFGHMLLNSQDYSYVVEDANGLALAETGWTISLWVNPNNMGAWQDVFGFDLGENRFKLERQGGNSFAIYSSNQSYNITDIAYPDNNAWMHLAFAYAADGTLNVYLDGKLVKTSTIVANGNLTKLIMGTNGVYDGGTVRNSSAMIDEVAIYGGTLDLARIIWLAKNAPSALPYEKVASMLPGEGYLTTTSQLVWKNMKLADIMEFHGMVSGKNIDGTKVDHPACFVVNDGTTATMNFQINNNGGLADVRGVTAEFTQVGKDVYGRAISAYYSGDNGSFGSAYWGEKEFTWSSGRTVSTGDNVSEYGCKTIFAYRLPQVPPQDITVHGSEVKISAVNALVYEGTAAANVTLDANAKVKFDAVATTDYSFVCNGALTFDGFPGQQELAKYDFSGVTGGYKQAAKVIGINFNAGQGRSANGDASKKLGDNADATVPAFTVYGRSLTQIVGASSGTVNGLKLYDTATDTVSDLASASVVYSSKNNYTVNNSSANLIEGYLDDGNQVKISVSGIPFDAYDVIVISGTDSDGRKFSPMMVNGVLYTSNSDGSARQASGPADTWGQSKVTTITMGTNAMRVNNLVGDLSVIGGKNANSARGGISAIMIIERKLRIGDEYVFSNGDCTATNNGGVGGYRPNGLTVSPISGITTDIGIAVKDVTLVLENTSSAKANYITINNAAGESVNSGAPSIGGQWLKQDMSELGPQVKWTFDTPQEITVDTEATMSASGDSRVRLYKTTDNIRGCYLRLSNSMDQWRPAYSVTMVITSLPTYEATINGEKSWGNLEWSNVPTEDDEAVLTVAGDSTLTMDGTEAFDTLKLVGEDDLTIANINGADVTKIDYSGFTGALTFEIDATAGLTADSALMELIKNAPTTMKFVFKGSGSNGATLSYGNTQTDKAIGTHIVFDGGTHVWHKLCDNSGLKFGENATVDNPTMLVTNGATLTWEVKNPCGWSAGAANTAGILRINDGSKVIYKQVSGTAYWTQQIYIEPGAEFEINDSNANDQKFRIAGGTNKDACQIYVPGRDSDDGKVAKITQSNTAGLWPKNEGTAGMAIYVGANSTLEFGAGVRNDRTVTKYGDGKLVVKGTGFATPLTIAEGSLGLTDGSAVANLTINKATTIDVPSGAATITAITGDYAITKTGAGTLNLPSGYAGTVTLRGGVMGSAFAGNLKIDGVLDLSNVTSFPIGGTVVASGNTGSIKLPASFVDGQIVKFAGESFEGSGLTILDSTGTDITANLQIVEGHIVMVAQEITATLTGTNYDWTIIPWDDGRTWKNGLKAILTIDVDADTTVSIGFDYVDDPISASITLNGEGNVAFSCGGMLMCDKIDATELDGEVAITTANVIAVHAKDAIVYNYFGFGSNEVTLDLVSNEGAITVKNTANAKVNINAGASDLTYNYLGNTPIAPLISTTGNFTKDGSGTITGLNFGTSYTGTVTINNGTVSTTAFNAFGTAPKVTVVYPAVWEITNTGTVDERNNVYTGITGNGTIRYSGSNWHAFPYCADMWAKTLGFQSEVDGGGAVISEPNKTFEIGSLSGTKGFRSDFSGGANDRDLRVTQSRNTTWSGNFTNGDRFRTMYVAGAQDATEKTLTIAGTFTNSDTLNVESTGSVNLTGTWKGDVTVAGEFGGSGSVVNASTITVNAGANIRADWGAVALNVAPTFGGAISVMPPASGDKIFTLANAAEKYIGVAVTVDGREGNYILEQKPDGIYLCEVGANGIVISVAAGETITKTLIAGYSYEKTGDGTLVLGAGSTANEITVSGGEVAYDIGTTRDASSLAFGTIRVGDGAKFVLNAVATATECRNGSIAVSNIPNGVTKVRVAFADEEPVLVDVESGAISYTRDPIIYGAACWYDFTFTNTISTATGSQNQATMNRDNSPEYLDGGTYLKTRPYLETQAFKNALATLETFTVALVTEMPTTRKMTVLSIGTDVSSSGSGMLHFATGANDDEVLINYVTNASVYNITKMTVPDSTTRHVYMVEKTGARTFVIFLDGVKRKTVSVDYDINFAGGGLQIGSDFGGRIRRTDIPEDQHYAAVETKNDGIVYVLRLYNDIVSDAEMKAYAKLYPYKDLGGSSSRTLTASAENWVESDSTPWLYEKPEQDSQEKDAAVAGSSIVLTLGENVTATEIAVNLAENTTYKNFTVSGAADQTVKFAKSENCGTIKITGDILVGSPIIVEYGAIDFAGVPVVLADGGSLTFDYSDYVVTGKYAAFEEELTGDVEQDDTRITVIPPTDPNWNAEAEYRSGAYGIRFTPKRESATTLYLALNAEETTTIGNDTLFTLEDGVTKVLRFYADDKVVLTGTGAFSVTSGLAVPLNSITIGEGATVKPADKTFTGTIVVDEGGTLDINHQQENWTGSVVLNGGVLTDSVGEALDSQVQNNAISLTADSEIRADNFNILSIGGGYNEFNFPLNGHTLTKTGSAKYEIYKPKFTTGGKLVVSAGELKINGFTVDGAALVELEVVSGATLTFDDPNSKGFTKNGRLNLKLGEGASFTNDQGIGFDELAGTGTFVATGVTAFSDMIDFKGTIKFDLSELEPISELTLITAPTDTDFLLDGITFALDEDCEDAWTLKVSADKVVAASTIKLIEVDGKAYPTMAEAFDAVSSGSILRILDADRLAFDGESFTLDGAPVTVPAGLMFWTGEGGTIVASIPSGSTPLRISEICPKPDDLDPNGVESSWVELVNENAFGYIDLGEYELQRFNRGKAAKAGKFANLVSRRLGAGERIVVYMTEGYTDGDDLAFAKGLVAEDEVKEVNGIMIVPAKVNPKKYPLVRLLKGKTVVDSVIVPSDLPDGKSVIVGHSTDGATQRWVAEPTKGAANPSTEGLVAIGPNVGPLYGVKHDYSDNDPVEYAESGVDYPVTLDVNPVDAKNSNDAIASVKLIYRTDINNDDSTTFGTVDMVKGEEPDEFHGDRWTASIPASALPAAGMLVQWKAEITDAAGNKWTSPSFMNKDDGYEWYGTIVHPDEDTQLSGSLDTMHVFATTVAKGGTGDRFIVSDVPGNGSGNRIMNIDYDALMTESGHADQKAAYPYGARVNIFDSSTMRYYDYVRIDLRGNTSASFKKKSHGLRFAKANPLKIAAKDGFNGINVKEIRKTSFISEMCDPSRLRQMTSFWLFNNENSLAPFDYPVRLNLNGQFYQIGFHSERFTDDLIEKSYGLNKFVYSYKNIGTFQPGSGTTAGGIEKKTPDDGNETGTVALKELEAFRQSIRAAGNVTASKDGASDTGLENAALTKTVVESFDLPSWLNYLAIARITHENDDVWANISGYWDSPWTIDGVRGTGTWHPLVYDTNLSFGQWYYQDDSERGRIGLVANDDSFKSHPFYGGCRVRAYKTNGTAVGNSNYAVESIYQHEKFRRLYLRRLRTLMDKYLADGEEATNPIAVKMREFLTYMGCNFENESDGADCDKELEVWGHVTDGGSGCGAVNVWTADTEPKTLVAGYKEIWNSYILPRRTHLFETHAAAGHTEDQIGYANNLCAGIPARQSELATLIGADDSLNFTVRYDATIKAVIIKNRNAEAVDMSGWTLEGPIVWTLPAGTVVDQAIDGVPGELYVTADRRFTIGAMGEIIDQVVVGNGEVGTGALVLKSGETIVAQESEPTVDFDDDTDTPVATGVSVPAEWLRENVLELRKVDVTDPAEGPTVNAAIKKLGRNGFRIWESWTLGLEPKVETSKPFLVGVQNNEADEVAFEFGGIEVKTGDNVPAVSYAVEFADSLGEGATWTPSGDPSTTPSISVGLPTTESGKKVRYYRPKFSFGN